MHNADNGVTQADREAVDIIGGHMASYYEFSQSDEYAAAQEAARDFRLASIEAACRERDQLRAKLDEARSAASEVIDRASMTYRARNGRDCYIEDDSGERCVLVPHEAWDNLHAFLASAPASEEA